MLYTVQCKGITYYCMKGRYGKWINTWKDTKTEKAGMNSIALSKTLFPKTLFPESMLTMLFPLIGWTVNVNTVLLSSRKQDPTLFSIQLVNLLIG